MKARILQSRTSWYSKYVPLAGSGCVLCLPGQDDPQSSTIRDISGQGNNGTITTASWTRTEKGLWVLSFDGSNDYISCGNDSSLLFTSEAFTMLAWLYPDNFAGDKMIVCRGLYETDGWYAEIYTTQKIGLRTHQAGAHQITQSSASMTATTWQHVAFVRSGASVTIYRNGTDITDSAGIHVDPRTNTRNLYIGQYDLSSARFLGDMALWALHNVALSQAQVQGMYNRQRHLFGV